MDATMSEPAMSQQYPIGSRLQLKQYKAELWPIDEAAYNTKPITPSEWWSKEFPEQAKIFGCPFLELLEPLGDGIDKVTPIALNIDFLAATLSGDSKLNHK